MFKLLIVDDEVIFRNVLPRIIDWSSLGFEIAGVAKNGIEALEFVKLNPVDVVLTDIRMPELNGLELAMELKTKYPRIKTVLLSAFNEFEYARKGIDCGVYGYILKTEHESVISSYFDKIGKELTRENQYENAINSDNTSYNALHKKQEFLKSILYCKETGKLDHLMDDALNFGINLKSEYYYIAIIQIDEVKNIIEAAGLHKANELRTVINQCLLYEIETKNIGYIFENCEQFVLLIKTGIKDIHTIVYSWYDEIKNEIEIYADKNELTVSLTCAVGTCVNALHELKESYDDAIYALKCKAYLGNSRVIFYDEVNLKIKRAVSEFLDFDEIYKNIKAISLVGSPQEIEVYLGQIEDSLLCNKVTDLNDVLDFCIKTIVLITEEVSKIRGVDNEIKVKSEYTLKFIINCETISSLFRMIKVFLVEVSIILSNNENVSCKKIVEQALKYINDHYAEKVTLGEVAEFIHVHPVHLSRLFSKHLGNTFKNVLTDVRIEAAKKLLMDINYKIFEVSYKVGFEKPRYFSELFKSVTGLTPLEYREKYNDMKVQ